MREITELSRWRKSVAVVGLAHWQSVGLRQHQRHNSQMYSKHRYYELGDLYVDM
jgi:hypothetical protein